MNRYSTTSDFIANAVKSSGYTAGDIIQTDGYTNKGDRGGAQWKATSNVIAVSQDPLALNDIKLSDASGNEFELVAEGVIDLNALGGTSASYQAIADNASLVYSQGLSAGVPTRTPLIIDTVAELKAVTGAQVGISYYQVKERANALFEVIAGTGTANGFDVVAHNTEDLSFKIIVNPIMPYSAIGYDESAVSQNSFNAALTPFLSANNVKMVFDSSSGNMVDTNSDGDASGRKIDLNGNSYRFSHGNTGGIYNGKAVLRDTWINGASNSITKERDLNSIYRSSPPTTAGKKRFPIFVDSDDVSAGGLIETFRKCDGSSFWIAENIVTQEPSGIDTSIDTLCPAWRLGQLSMCDYVGTQLFTHSNINGTPTLIAVTPPGNGNLKTDANINRFGSQGDWVEYETICYEHVAILFQYTTSGTIDAHIEIFDQNDDLVFEQGDVSLKSTTLNQELFVWQVANPRPGQTLRIRITNRTASVGVSQFMGVGGVSAVANDYVTGQDIDNIFYSKFTTGDDKVRSFFSGAMDYAIMEEDLLKFGGESHGGEVMSMQDFYVDGNAATITTGNYHTALELRIEQQSVTTFPNSSSFNTRSKHRFYSYPAAHDFSATHTFSDGFMARIAYGPMLTTHTMMDTMILPELINANVDGFSGSEERYEIGKSEYVRIESTVNPFINEMWFSALGGQYNESTPWWKIHANANGDRKFYYGPVSSTSCGRKDMSKQPYATKSFRLYN